MFPDIAGSTLRSMNESPGVVDLLGVLAYAELSAFTRMTEDAARLAPTLADRTALCELAVAEYQHFRLLYDRVRELDADPASARRAVAGALDAGHAPRAPAEWMPALAEGYVGVGTALDCSRDAARRRGPGSGEPVAQVRADEGRAECAVERVRAGLEEDPTTGG